MIQYYSVKDVAAKLKVGVSTIWYWCKIGKFPKGLKFGSHTTRWSDADLNDFSKSSLELEEKPDS